MSSQLLTVGQKADVKCLWTDKDEESDCEDVPIKKQKLTTISDSDLDHIDIMDDDSTSGLPFHVQDIKGGEVWSTCWLCHSHIHSYT